MSPAALLLTVAIYIAWAIAKLRINDWPWLHSKYFLHICVSTEGDHFEISFRIGCVPSEARQEHLQNRSQNGYRLPQMKKSARGESMKQTACTTMRRTLNQHEFNCYL